MEININDIDENGLVIEAFKSPNWFTNISEFNEKDESLQLKSDVSFNLNVSKIAKEIFVNGNSDFTLIMNCSRCLKLVERKIKNKIKLVMSPGDSEPESQGDIDHETYDSELVDLSAYLREKVALSIPYKVVCNDECKGLCPRCGINLNTQNCECVIEEPRSKFAVLKDLKV